MNRKNILILSLIFGFSMLHHACSAQESSPLQSDDSSGTIDADNAKIEYIGRFDRTDPKKAIFDWSGIYIRAKFEGTSCSIRLNDGNNYYAVKIDDQEPLVLKTDTSTVYPVASDLSDSIHTILIQKRTEAFIGKGEFLGFTLDENKNLVMPDASSNRRIEFIGNSITCGYGVEGENTNSPFKPETENASLSFAALLSRALNADYQIVAYSGKGVVRNYGDSNMMSAIPMPALYNRTLCSDSLPIWDYTSWVPQVVVINLGTNDYSTQPHPDKAIFQEGYTQLINCIQSQYANVTIFCICGPMIGEPCAGYIEQVVETCQQNNTNKEIYFINVGDNLLTMSDRGSDWHPNVKGQQKTANVILPVIQDIMNW